MKERHSEQNPDGNTLGKGNSFFRPFPSLHVQAGVTVQSVSYISWYSLGYSTVPLQSFNASFSNSIAKKQLSGTSNGSARANYTLGAPATLNFHWLSSFSFLIPARSSLCSSSDTRPLMMLCLASNSCFVHSSVVNILRRISA